MLDIWLKDLIEFLKHFPIEDLNDKATLEYVSYKLEKPKFDVMNV